MPVSSLNLTVVVPVRSMDVDFERTLCSIQKQKNISLDIILVFNPAAPKSPPKGVRVFESAEGANRARNVGLKNALYDLIYFLDSDCELISEFALAERCEYMSKNADWVAAGGPYLISDGANVTTRAYNYIQNQWLYSHVQDDKSKTPFLIGGNMLIRKSLMQGLEFDENIKFGATEKELFCRLQKINSNIYFFPQWPVVHFSSLSTKQLLLKAKAQAEGNRYIEKKGVLLRPIKNFNFPPPEPELKDEVELYLREWHRVYAGVE